MHNTNGHPGVNPARPIVLVGAGLANLLIALRLKQRYPERHFVLIEQASGLSRQHTWSFHLSDIGGAQAWVRPLMSCQWDAYEVRFPEYSRRLESPYASIRSKDFAAKLQPLLASHLKFGVKVRQLAQDHVVFDNGESMAASLVLDGRGFWQRPVASGWQTFFGRFVRTAVPHGLREPTLMDATLAQHDAYRFIYVLPWSEDTLLIEDTRYADGPEHDGERSKLDIEAYAQSRGWQIAEVFEDEAAALPIPCLNEMQPELGDYATVRSGVHAGLYHPITGYSFGRAVAFADTLVEAIDDPDICSRMRRYAEQEWQRGAFLRRLNAMFFRAAEPGRRWRVMQQFYRRDAALIERFYSMRLSPMDHLRLLGGIPQVPIGRGFVTFFNLFGGHRRANVLA